MVDIAQRLKELRESRGLTLVKAARTAGFKNFQTLSKIENGERTIKVEDIVALAHAYSFDINLFLLDEPKPKCVQIFWRSNPNPPRDTSAKSKLSLFFERYLHLGKLLELPNTKLNLPILSFVDITLEKASYFGEKYSEMLKLGDRPALSLISILETECNLPIFYLDLPKSTSAISLITNDNAAICLNSTETSWRQRFDVAHELFHILHRKSISDDCGENDETYFEKYANAFASALLLPKGILENEIDIIRKKERIGIPTLIAMACDFGVSYQALLWRLVNIGRMKRKIIDEILTSPAVKDYDRTLRKDKAVHSPFISQKYLCRVFEAMSQGYMTRMRAAEYLDISVNKLEDLFLNAGLMSQEDSNIEVTIM